jgi:hypothetical protein
MLISLLTWLDGRKALIGTCLGAINAYLMATGVFTPELGSLIATLIVVLTGVGISATNSVLGRRNKFGERTK